VGAVTLDQRSRTKFFYFLNFSATFDLCRKTTKKHRSFIAICDFVRRACLTGLHEYHSVFTLIQAEGERLAKDNSRHSMPRGKSSNSASRQGSSALENFGGGKNLV